MHFQGLSHNDIKKKQILLFSKCGKSGKMWQKCQNVAKSRKIC